MKHKLNLFVLKTFSCCLIFNTGLFFSQTAVLAEFKALPAFPLGAKEAFNAVKVMNADGYYSFDAYSDPATAYQKKLEADTDPFQQIILAKGTAGIAPGLGAANDFSDLSSPETQAKLAKMSQEEQIKFAMEIQERMKNNANLQKAGALKKSGPLTALVSKLNTSAQKLLSFLPEYTTTPFPGYPGCNNLCPVIEDPSCAARTRACENKAAHAFYTPEVKRYNDFIKNTSTQFAQNRITFEKDLKEFDLQASKYPKEEVAADYMNVFAMLAVFSGKLQEYEKQGASIIIETKNNSYCKSDY